MESSVKVINTILDLRDLNIDIMVRHDQTRSEELSDDETATRLEAYFAHGNGPHSDQPQPSTRFDVLFSSDYKYPQRLGVLLLDPIDDDAYSYIDYQIEDDNTISRTSCVRSISLKGSYDGGCSLTPLEQKNRKLTPYTVTALARLAAIHARQT